MQGICRKCREPIEVGEACIPEQNGIHTRFIHTGCYAKEKAERLEAEMQNKAQLARTVY